MNGSIPYSNAQGTIPDELRTTCQQLRRNGGREEEHWMRTFTAE